MRYLLLLFICLPMLVSAGSTNLKQCTTNTDCVLIQESCCDCNNGGKNQAINRHFVAMVNQQRHANCAQTMCVAMISQDKSCNKDAKPICLSGLCEIG